MWISDIRQRYDLSRRWFLDKIDKELDEFFEKLMSDVE